MANGFKDQLQAPNGRTVTRVRTASGVTGYIDASIPKPALEGLAAKLRADLAAPDIKPADSSSKVANGS